LSDPVRSRCTFRGLLSVASTWNSPSSVENKNNESTATSECCFSGPSFVLEIWAGSARVILSSWRQLFTASIFKHHALPRRARTSLSGKIAECTTLANPSHPIHPHFQVRIRLVRAKSFCKGDIVKRRGCVFICSGMSSRTLPEKSYGRGRRS